MKDRQSTVEEPRAVSVGILKGGVGKSTIAINLAERLGARGHSVLLVDLDPDGHASSSLGFDDVYDDTSSHLGDVVLDEGDGTFEDVIYETEYGFDLLPSNEQLKTVETQISQSAFPYTRLKTKLIDPLLGSAYDYIITDSSAVRGTLADTALVATGNAIIPVNAAEEVVSGLEKTYRKQIVGIKEQMEFNVLAIVPNDFASRNNEENRLIDELERDFPEKLPDFGRSHHFDDEDSKGPGIRHRIDFSRASAEDKPLAYYNPESDQLERLDELADIVIRGGIDG